MKPDATDGFIIGFWSCFLMVWAVVVAMSLLGCTQYHESRMSHADFTGKLMKAGWTAGEAEEDWVYYQHHKSRY